MTPKDDKKDDTKLIPFKAESKFRCLWREHKLKIVMGLIVMFVLLAIIIMLVVKKVKQRHCVSGEYRDICSMYESNLHV